jgi:uncharacterized metal-binding protein YceD (DUF177 family)
VDYPATYTIAFNGLKPGTHNFDFQVGLKFFEQVEDDEIKDGNVAIAVTMVKEERMMDFHFSISGSVVVSCDRCTDPVEVEVQGEERLIVKLGEKYMEESEDVQIIPESSHQVDLSSFIYEYIHLLLPARRIHPDDDAGNSLCNPEVIQKLKELSERHEPDPRWEALKKLNN